MFDYKLVLSESQEFSVWLTQYRVTKRCSHVGRTL